MRLPLLRGRHAHSGRRSGPSPRAAIGFGLFAIVTIGLTFYFGVRISNVTFQSSYTLTADFDDVSGLKSGDEVKIDGATVGRVGSVKVKLGKAAVSMDVRDNVRMPVDSTAVVRWKDLIGTREVYLQPGTSDSVLPHGGHLTHTESAVDLGTVINSLGPLIGSVDPQEVNQILQSFATALSGNEGNINQITNNLTLLVNTLGSRTQTIDGMIKDYKTVTDAVSARDAEIASTVTNLNALTKTFSDSSGVLDSALRQMATFSGNLKGAVGGQAAQISQVVSSTQSLLAIANRNSTKLRTIINGLPPALQAVMTTMDGGHFTRTALVCLQLNEYTDTCPFKEVLPPPAASNGTKMTAQERTNFDKVATLFLLGAVAGGDAAAK